MIDLKTAGHIHCKRMEYLLNLMDILGIDATGNQDGFIYCCNIFGGGPPVESLPSTSHETRLECIYQDQFCRECIGCLDGEIFAIAIGFYDRTLNLSGIVRLLMPMQLHIVKIDLTRNRINGINILVHKDTNPACLMKLSTDDSRPFRTDISITLLPKDKSNVTGIVYEPWHYRYVGKTAAEEIMKKNLTLEEYLLQ